MTNDNAAAMAKIGEAVNGEGVLKGDPEIVKALRNLVKRAEAGEIAGVAIVVSHAPDVSSLVSSGRFPATLVMGMERLKGMLLDSTFGQPKAPSGLVLPRRAM